MRGSQRLAVLKNCAPVEMFWLGCDFERDLAFAEIEPIFHEASNTLIRVRDTLTFNAAMTF
ncbi:MAG: hypothetical protein SGI73_20195 [Chloroflexota bacterium]|nr:hypothetical protein [Chloroflexota bacterium]